MAEDKGIRESSEAESVPPSESAPITSRSVFLSYASHDADTANSICQFLESHGLSCWVAPRDVRPGTEYADAIVAAINEAKAVVLLLSGSAVAVRPDSRTSPMTFSAAARFEREVKIESTPRLARQHTV